MKHNNTLKRVQKKSKGKTDKNEKGMLLPEQPKPPEKPEQEVNDGETSQQNEDSD